MIYQFDSRVRYSEVDMDKKLTLPSILNYFQDCSSFHSEYLGVGIDYLKDRQCAWVLSAWQIVLGNVPVFGQKVTVQTWPYAFKGFLGFRNFCLRDEQGEKLAWANSIWTYVDLKTGHPARVSKREAEVYVSEERLEMDYAPRKISIPAEKVQKESFPVVRHYLDTNHHVNNGQYVQMAMEFLPENFQIGQMRAEYKKAALLGDVIVPYVAQTDEVCTVLLCGEGETTYAVVEFTKKKGNSEGAEQL